jgi:hypothetical protein
LAQHRLLLLLLQVKLRAAVDHMHGVACEVQQVPSVLLLILLLLLLLQVNLHAAVDHMHGVACCNANPSSLQL